MRYEGGCHCGRVRFELAAPADLVCWDCNCSICAKAGYLHLIVPESQFKLLRGSETLIEYRFNTGAARHLFCRVCGVKSYYVPRSNPDGIDVNLRCLEPVPPHYRVEPFDGQHWEQHAAALAHLSKEAST